VAELNHLSSKHDITDAFEPNKDVNFGKRIMQYARKSFQNLEIESKNALDKQSINKEVRDINAKMA